MINRKLSLFILLLNLSFLTFFNSNAQQCGTDIRFEEWKKVTPNWQDQISVINDNNVERRDGKKIIPVVFHIIHTNGSENISNEQVFDAIRILNEDFNKQNTDWHNVRNSTDAPFLDLVADFELEFVLAKKDPEGNCTNGINRIVSDQHQDAGDNIKSLIKWPVNRYMNIWVVSNINSSGASGIILGYSNFPWMNQNNDGIVMRSDCVGSIGSADPVFQRALTHEVGHYLGLMHTFQGGCNGRGDEVDDTPPVAEQFSNTGCKPTNKSCSKSKYFDQWENFMDYSHGCQSMFTLGQKSRSNSFLSDTRYTRRNLYTQENLEFTGIIATSGEKPSAYFESNLTVVCAGSPIQFFDNSCQGEVSQRTWVFNGADIQSSNQPSPIVTFESAGEYTIKLTTSNSKGSSSYESKITVLPKVAEYTGISESFEYKDVFSIEGITELTGIGFESFERAEGIGYYGKNSLKANISQSNIGKRFVLETPSLNISKMSGMNPKISFMVGYGRRNNSSTDYVRIYISDDCGNSWVQKYQRISGQISSSQGFVENFTPTHQGEWKRVQLSLSEYQNSTSLKIRIEIVSGGGNPIFIDDINVSQYSTTIENIDNNLDVSIFPNPSNDIFHINLSNSYSNKVVSMKLFDISGKEITSIIDNKIINQKQHFVLKPKQYNLKSGIYFIKIETNEGILTKRLIFAD